MTHPITQLCRHHGITLDELRGPCRRRRIAMARWEAMRALHGRGLSNGQIGMLLNRDPSTVHHGLRRMT